MRDGAAMHGAAEEEPRIRRQLKRDGGEIVEAGVHRCCPDLERLHDADGEDVLVEAAEVRAVDGVVDGAVDVAGQRRGEGIGHRGAEVIDPLRLGGRTDAADVVEFLVAVIRIQAEREVGPQIVVEADGGGHAALRILDRCGAARDKNLILPVQREGERVAFPDMRDAGGQHLVARQVGLGGEQRVRDIERRAGAGSAAA